MLTILGIAKITGAIAILQPKIRTIKEWAYAEFTFIFNGASASHASLGNGSGMIITPVVVMAVMFISYFL